MGRSVAEERALEIVLSVYPHTDGGSYVTSDYCLSEEFFVEEPVETFLLEIFDFVVAFAVETEYWITVGAWTYQLQT